MSPSFTEKHGRHRHNYEASLAIDRARNWHLAQPVQFQEWQLAEQERMWRDWLPRVYSKLFQIGTDNRKGSRPGEVIQAIRLIMDRFDPDFRPDRGGLVVNIKPLSEVVEALDAEPYEQVTYDTAQAELPAPEDADNLRDDAVRELMGEDD